MVKVGMVRFWAAAKSPIHKKASVLLVESRA